MECLGRSTAYEISDSRNGPTEFEAHWSLTVAWMSSKFDCVTLQILYLELSYGIPRYISTLFIMCAVISQHTGQFLPPKSRERDYGFRLIRKSC